MKISNVALSVAMFVFAGCASTPPPPLPPLNEAEYQPYTISGTGKVFGSAFLVTKGGDIKKAAARQVFLIPETSFLLARMNAKDEYYTTFEWLGFSGTDGNSIARAWRHTKIAVADVDGKFTFSKVPPGKYYVETQLFWQYVSCGFFGCKPADTGAVLRKYIEVSEGAEVEVQLTSVINR